MATANDLKLNQDMASASDVVTQGDNAFNYYSVSDAGDQWRINETYQRLVRNSNVEGGFQIVTEGRERFVPKSLYSTREEVIAEAPLDFTQQRTHIADTGFVNRTESQGPVYVGDDRPYTPPGKNEIILGLPVGATLVDYNARTGEYSYLPAPDYRNITSIEGFSQVRTKKYGTVYVENKTGKMYQGSSLKTGGIGLTEIGASFLKSGNVYDDINKTGVWIGNKSTIPTSSLNYSGTQYVNISPFKNDKAIPDFLGEPTSKYTESPLYYEYWEKMANMPEKDRTVITDIPIGLAMMVTGTAKYTAGIVTGRESRNPIKIGQDFLTSSVEFVTSAPSKAITRPGLLVGEVVGIYAMGKATSPITRPITSRVSAVGGEIWRDVRIYGTKVSRNIPTSVWLERSKIMYESNGKVTVDILQGKYLARKKFTGVEIPLKPTTEKPTAFGRIKEMVEKLPEKYRRQVGLSNIIIEDKKAGIRTVITKATDKRGYPIVKSYRIGKLPEAEYLESIYGFTVKKVEIPYKRGSGVGPMKSTTILQLDERIIKASMTVGEIKQLKEQGNMNIYLKKSSVGNRYYKFNERYGYKVNVGTRKYRGLNPPSMNKRVYLSGKNNINIMVKVVKKSGLKITKVRNDMVEPIKRPKVEKQQFTKWLKPANIKKTPWERHFYKEDVKLPDWFDAKAEPKVNNPSGRAQTVFKSPEEIKVYPKTRPVINVKQTPRTLPPDNRFKGYPVGPNSGYDRVKNRYEGIRKTYTRTSPNYKSRASSGMENVLKGRVNVNRRNTIISGPKESVRPGTRTMPKSIIRPLERNGQIQQSAQGLREKVKYKPVISFRTGNISKIDYGSWIDKRYRKKPPTITTGSDEERFNVFKPSRRVLPRYSRITEYKPSVRAVYQGTTTRKKPKILTGYGIRPIYRRK